jgi:aminoglycoside 3-N-acetyltransferase
MVVTARQWLQALSKLGIDRTRPVLIHASLSAFGTIDGGTASVVTALAKTFDTVVAPAFTYRTMVTPEDGPSDNAIQYGRGRGLTSRAEPFHMTMPADKLMGVIVEAVRQLPEAKRSAHPILSFTGINAASILTTQSIKSPLAPIKTLAMAAGWILLLGVDHTVNTSIHFAERLVGREGFVRWSLTPAGIQECPGFPGCSNGFQQIAPHLQGISRRIRLGKGQIEAIPLTDLVRIVCEWIVQDPAALLCNHRACMRCKTTRQRSRAALRISPHRQ